MDTGTNVGRLSRRRLLSTAATVAGTATVGVALSAAGLGAPTAEAAAAKGPAAGTAAAKGPTADLEQIPATENLMREHGVLKRVLLIYDEAGRRITAKQQLPAQAVQAAATIIHDYIEGFHEALEEGYVFPRLRKAGILVPTVDTLLTQHARGRLLTQAILSSATTAGLANPTTSAQIAEDMALFVRMYEPHEAREDTVVFPAYRSLLSNGELEEVAQTVASDQSSQFGPKGFANVVAQVTKIEITLGIADLDQFTPPAVSP